MDVGRESLATRRNVWAVVLAVLLVQACDSPTKSEIPMLLTENASYDLVADSKGWSAEISYTFTNRTQGTVYRLLRCGGGSAWILEQYVDGVWELAWGPFLNSCLSSPIEIARGATFIDTLNVWGLQPGEYTSPPLGSHDPNGTYRIVWHEALSSIESDDFPLGPQISLEARTSNSFELVVR